MQCCRITKIIFNIIWICFFLQKAEQQQQLACCVYLRSIKLKLKECSEPAKFGGENLMDVYVRTDLKKC